MTTKRKNYATDNDAWERLKAGATMTRNQPRLRIENDRIELEGAMAQATTTTMTFGPFNEYKRTITTGLLVVHHRIDCPDGRVVHLFYCNSGHQHDSRQQAAGCSRGCGACENLRSGA